MGYKILPLIFLGIFLISMVSAFTENNSALFNSTSSRTGDVGMNITIGNTNVYLYNITLASGVQTNGTAYLVNGTGCTVIAVGSLVGGALNNTYDFPTRPIMSANLPYGVLVYAAGTIKFQSAWTYPTVGTYLNWTQGMYAGCGTQQPTEIDSVQAIGLQTSVLDTITTTLNAPVTTTNSSQPSNSFNATGVIASGNLNNATLYVWYSNGTLFGTNTTTVTGTTNTTNLSLSGFTIGSYLWNEQFTGTNTTGQTISSFATSNYTFNVGSIIGNASFNSSAYETSSQNYSINITSYQSIIPSTAYLQFNGVNYTATIVNTSNGNFTFYPTNLPIIPLGTTPSVNFSFTWDLNGIWETSPTNTQTITNITLAYCNTGTSYVNFTFKDESNSSSLNGSIASGTSFTYYEASGDGTLTKTLTYSNVTYSPYYSFCLSPSTPSIKMSYSINYLASGYPQRTYAPSVTTFSNTTTNQVLYLLSSVDGLYVTFQVLSASGQQISGVQVNASTSISGITTLVAQGNTGTDGAVTFWLNPNAVHTVNFSKTGYNSYSTTITPTQSTYTITLGSTTSSTVNDYTRGVTYSIIPNPNVFLNNGTLYNFSYTINSSYWVLDNFSIVVYGNNGTILGTNSSTASLGTINITANTSNYAWIGMNYTYVTNGTTITLTAIYTVYNTAIGNGWSISTFFTDFKTYITSGIFGADASAVSLILFLCIFIGTGIMSYKFGISSPATITGIIFLLTFSFDIALDLDSYINPIGAITYFPTIFVGLIMAGFIFKEVTQ